MYRTLKCHTKKSYNKIINLTTGQIFNSAQEAADFYKVNTCNIYRACNGKRRIHSYRLARLQDYLNGDIPDFSYGYHSYRVLCVETETEYFNAIIAEEQTGIKSAEIRRACRGDVQTAGGYHWQRLEENFSQKGKNSLDKMLES